MLVDSVRDRRTRLVGKVISFCGAPTPLCHIYFPGLMKSPSSGVRGGGGWDSGFEIDVDSCPFEGTRWVVGTKSESP